MASALKKIHESTALVAYDDLEEQKQPEFGADEMAVPRLKVAQDLTPQVKKSESAYIPGLEAGDIFNTVTEKVWKGREGIYLVPCAFVVSYTEWVPRSKGGGMVADRSDEENIAGLWQQFRREQDDGRVRCILENGNELNRTPTYFVMIVDPETGQFEEAVFGLSGSMAKVSKKWNSVIASRRLKRSNGAIFTPLPCAFFYRAATVVQRKDSDSWYGLSVTRPGDALSENPDGEVLRLPEGKSCYDAARYLRTLVQEGRKTAAPEVNDEANSASSLTDEIPF
jgi:hypothetical protein